MKFYSEPNMSVFKMVKQGRFNKKVLAFKFDENGEFETEDNRLIEKLKIHFKHDEKSKEPTKEPEPIKEIICKQCSKSFENKGLLLAHIRKEHPKKR